MFLNHIGSSAVAIAGTSLSSAAALPEYTDDDRSVSATVEYCDIDCNTGSVICDGESNRVEPTKEFEPFDMIVESSVLDPGANGYLAGTASQESTLLPDRVVGRVSVRQDQGSPHPSCDQGDSFISSRLSWDMRLEETTLVEINIVPTALTGVDSLVNAVVGWSPNYALRQSIRADSVGPIHAVIPAPAGEYGWSFTASIVLDDGEPNSTQEAEFDAEIIFHGATCSPADLGLPAGVLDLGDVQAFVTHFVNGNEYADLAAPEGTLDIADLQAFISAFVAGCP